MPPYKLQTTMASDLMKRRKTLRTEPSKSLFIATPLMDLLLIEQRQENYSNVLTRLRQRKLSLGFLLTIFGGAEGAKTLQLQ